MDKDQEILAISRLVFELTKIGDADLDKMLARLFDLLQTLPGILVQPRSLILLQTSRRALIQVAQHGLPPAWAQAEMTIPPAGPVAAEEAEAFLATPASLDPPLVLPGLAADAPCFVLPLNEGEHVAGRALLFIDPAWQPDAVEFEFMSDLAKALSVLVSRCVINETLRVREVELEDARTDAIRRLGTASEYRDNETGMHIMRMTHFATAIAKAMGLPAETRELLAICAPMHDVGKIGIPDYILLKPGRLTPEEFEVMKGHARLGHELLQGSGSEVLRAGAEIALTHHEKYDGSGYPRGLKGTQIPLFGRIVAVADVFDALTSERPYKKAWSLDDACRYLEEGRGKHFDPLCVEAFLAGWEEILEIRRRFQDEELAPLM